MAVIAEVSQNLWASHDLGTKRGHEFENGLFSVQNPHEY